MHVDQATTDWGGLSPNGSSKGNPMWGRTGPYQGKGPGTWGQQAWTPNWYTGAPETTQGADDWGGHPEWGVHAITKG